MCVKLIALSEPVVEGMNSAEDLVAYCARVSNPANQMNAETSGIRIGTLEVETPNGLKN